MSIAESQIQLHREFAELAAQTHAYWYGNAGWMPFWAPEQYVATQSDVSCMLSPEMYDAFVLPELDALARRFTNVWYHLDGHDARQHLLQPGSRGMQPGKPLGYIKLQPDPFLLA